VITLTVVVTGFGVQPGTGLLADGSRPLGPAFSVDNTCAPAPTRRCSRIGRGVAWWSRRYGRRLNVQPLGRRVPAAPAVGIPTDRTVMHAELVHDPVPLTSFLERSGSVPGRVLRRPPQRATAITSTSIRQRPGRARWNDDRAFSQRHWAVDQSKFIAAVRSDMPTWPVSERVVTNTPGRLESRPSL